MTLAAIVLAISCVLCVAIIAILAYRLGRLLASWPEHLENERRRIHDMAIRLIDTGYQVGLAEGTITSRLKARSNSSMQEYAETSEIV